jgi:transcriptional regulator with XRE-family HTH domain
MLSEEQFLNKLGQKIDELGRAKFKTQDSFSTACEIDTRTLRRIIKQDQNPSILVLRRIANGLGLTLIELIDID